MEANDKRFGFVFLVFSDFDINELEKEIVLPKLWIENAQISFLIYLFQTCSGLSIKHRDVSAAIFTSFPLGFLVIPIFCVGELYLNPKEVVRKKDNFLFRVRCSLPCLKNGGAFCFRALSLNENFPSPDLF